MCARYNTIASWPLPAIKTLYPRKARISVLTSRGARSSSPSRIVVRPPYHLKHFLFVYNGMPLGGREINAEGCSVARFAVYVHHAAVTLNYAIDHGQAQSCSPVHFHGLEIIGHPGVDGDLLFRPVKQGG